MGASAHASLTLGLRVASIARRSGLVCEQLLLLYAWVLSTFDTFRVARGLILLLFTWVLRPWCQDVLVFTWVLRGPSLKPMRIAAIIDSRA